MTPSHPAVDVSVLVPVLNEEVHLPAALAAMRAQRFEGGIELIFIDGHSGDATLEILRLAASEDDRVRILDNPRASTPVSLNIGLAAANGRYVARMDAHTHYPPDYLALGVGRLGEGGAAHVSGPQLARGEGRWSRRVALALSSPLGTGGAAFRRDSDSEFEVDSGFTGIWERSTLEREGGWDEGWPNDQDSELAARIRRGGGRIVCLPAMAADYVPRDSLRSLARQYWRYGEYRAKTFGRHPEAMRRSHVLSPGIAVTIVVAALPLGALSRLARGAMGAYVAAIALAAARAVPEAGAREAAWLPAVFACMHVPNGFGFLAGSLRFGPPLRALANLLRPGHG